MYALPEFDNPRNWSEDYAANGSGMYTNTCCDCKVPFFGHKRRFICKVCDKQKTDAAAALQKQIADGALTEEEMSILPKISLIDGLTAHLAASLQIDTANQEEMAGVEKIAQSAVEYFQYSTKGAPNGSGAVMQWILFSAAWEGKVAQAEIDAFFSNVNMDPTRMLAAWRSMSPQERQGVFTVALIPGKLDEADISDVAAALFHNRGAATGGLPG